LRPLILSITCLLNWPWLASLMSRRRCSTPTSSASVAPTVDGTWTNYLLIFPLESVSS
jgi:hypothetical protein